MIDPKLNADPLEEPKKLEKYIQDTMENTWITLIRMLFWGKF